MKKRTKLLTVSAAVCLAALSVITVNAVSAQEVKFQPIIKICEKLGINHPTDERYMHCWDPIPQMPDADASSVSGSFAADLNALMPRDKNYMISPLSIRTALMLAANGAEGETRDEMLKALDANGIDSFNLYSKQLADKLAANKDVEIATANAIWLNTDKAGGIRFDKNYSSELLKYYNAESDTVTDSNAESKINAWCSEHTNDKIKKIIDDSDFIACLTNAVYFKGSWAAEFDKAATQKAVFTDRNGSKTETEFMNRTGRINYYGDKNIQIAELPYKGGDIAMYVVLDKDKRTDITPYLDKMAYTEVHVSMPKFKIEYSRLMNDALAELGIKRAFENGTAQFGPMFEGQSGSSDFYISRVLHKTYIDVNEEGTEAAAVTAVTMQTNSIAAYEPPKEFIADKPFGFYIMDKESREVLFMGEYAFVE